MGALRFYAPYLKEHGCAGVSYTAYGLIMQELERADSGVRSLASVQGALAIQAIHSFGSPEQHARWLPGLVSGERVGCFALTEHGHGSDPGGMETRAKREGDDYILTAANAGSAMHLSRTSKLFGRRMTTAMSADSWLRRTRPDSARATSKGSSVCECHDVGVLVRRIAGSLRRIACRTLAGSVRRYRACRMRVSELHGASLARRLIATKQRWRTPKRANNSAAQLAASNSCNKSLSGWRRKSPRRSYWRSVLRA